VVPRVHQREVLSSAPAEGSLNLLVGFVRSSFALGSAVKAITVKVWV